MTSSTITADKTFAEITAAINAGNNVRAVIPMEQIFYNLSFADSEDIYFSSISYGNNDINADIIFSQITHNSLNEITKRYDNLARASN